MGGLAGFPPAIPIPATRVSARGRRRLREEFFVFFLLDVVMQDQEGLDLPEDAERVESFRAAAVK